MDIDMMKETALNGSEVFKEILNKINVNDVLSKNEKIKEFTEHFNEDKEIKQND